MDRVVFFGMILVASLGPNAAQSCCSPDQFRGLQSTTIGAEWDLSTDTTYYYYDYTNQRTASFLNFTLADGKVLLYEILALYSGPYSGMKYFLNLETRDCSADKLSYPFPKLCPSDVRQKVDLTLGAATESLPVTVYSMTNENRTFQYFTTVTRDLCIPVSEVSIYDHDGDVFTIVRGWADIQLGIASPSVFDVPSECKDAKPLHSDKRFQKFSSKASFTRRFFHL